jgi:O-antigen/teichoic acid export membrane protein
MIGTNKLNFFTGNARLLTLILRGLTLLSRFVFIIFLGRHLTIPELGFYGFITALIFSTVFLVGLEYGNYASRQIIKCKDLLCKQKTVVGLSVFGLIMFFTVSPFAYYFFHSTNLNSLIYAFFFFILTYGESYLAEHKKILISLNHPFFCGVIDFIRSALWTYLLIILSSLNLLNLNLTSILFIWAVFVVLSFILVFIKLKEYYKYSLFFSMRSFNDYKTQIFSSFPFFISGLSLIVFELSGRISLQFFGLYEQAGIYTLYSGFIFAIPIFVWSSSVAFDHPKIIESYENGDVFKSDHLVKEMIKRSLLICLILVILLYFGIDIVLSIINKEEYLSYIGQLYLFMIVPFIHIFDTHLYYMLLTRNLDKSIAFSAIVGSIFLVIFQYFTISSGGINSVILSIICAITISVLLKVFFIRRSIMKN